ncbi:alanyl-tRNA synthetase [Erysipelotrichaceae bacterium]|nr:alanyl-tRNA synthetase [Erysipelotrichaceae bacterium]
MKYRTSTEIRQLFLDFFVTKGHVIEPSSPLVPINDPSLLWINSGVAALKKYFDGSEIPNSLRIVNAQKSLRANDIENVGVTARHHTLFEMLGNFSIGDYFRKDAIHYGWEFLTSENWVGFPKEKLYVTVYPGDDETYNIWKNEIGLSADHIVMCEDNFWEIGEGPCGPCTEIFYDRGAVFNSTATEDELYVGGENDRYIEIWNIVFSQYNSKQGVARAQYQELPTKNIDTGMGLERMVSIIQGGNTNFETDLFLPIIGQIEALSGIEYATATAEQIIAFKLISDHIRAVVFAIADGALPSNEGRGYVIRRLLRRASRFAKKLGVSKPFLFNLTDIIVDVMGGYYGYLYSKVTMIKKVIFSEEEKFLTTLNEGEKKLIELLNKTTGTILAGEAAFTLYDTYGFPIELTIECAAEAGYEVDKIQFFEHMQLQKQRARAARVVGESMQIQGDVLANFKNTSIFVGYENFEVLTKVLLILKDSMAVMELLPTEKAVVILEKTPFYAESGGQIYDSGTLVSDRSVIRVRSVKKAPNGQFLHEVEVIEGRLDFETEYTAIIDINQRKAIQKNHTATHLLQKALRSIVGKHVEQAGSSVDSKRLRFDFSHFEAVTPSQLQKIEQKVNEMIWESAQVITEVLPISEAKNRGAMALFGEKYGEVVRVVMALDSIELCGGTHVSNTAEIGIFKIISESGIGSGVRRIEAYTSKAAFGYLKEYEQIVNDVQIAFKRKAKEDILEFAKSTLKKVKELETTIKATEKTMVSQKIVKALEQETAKNKAGDITTVEMEFANTTIQDLKSYIDIIKERATTYTVVLVGYEAHKTNIVIASSKDCVEQYNAKLRIQKLNTAIGSRGGGKPEIAQASIDEIIPAAEIFTLALK